MNYTKETKELTLEQVARAISGVHKALSTEASKILKHTDESDLDT